MLSQSWTFDDARQKDPVFVFRPLGVDDGPLSGNWWVRVGGFTSILQRRMEKALSGRKRVVVIASQRSSSVGVGKKVAEAVKWLKEGRA